MTTVKAHGAYRGRYLKQTKDRKFFNRKYNNPIYSYYGDKKQSFMKITITPSKLSCLSYQLPSISEEINVQTFPEILFSHKG